MGIIILSRFILQVANIDETFLSGSLQYTKTTTRRAQTSAKAKTSRVSRGKKYVYTVSQKTGPPQLIWYNFTNSQRTLIIIGTEIPCSILNSLSWNVFKLA